MAFVGGVGRETVDAWTGRGAVGLAKAAKTQQCYQIGNVHIMMTMVIL